MSEIYIISVEGKGDGSNNFGGYCRPGISVFSDIDLAAEAIYDYLESNRALETLVDEDSLSEDEDKNDRLFLEKCREIVEDVYHKINERHWIRVDVKNLNPDSLQKHYYYDWSI